MGLLITGISGFVGSNLSTYLNNSIEINGVLRNKTEGNISYYNITKEILYSYSGIVHLAGKSHDLKRTSKEDEYFKVNTELTIKLFDMFLASKFVLFIFISSVKAVVDSLKGKLSENCVPDPRTAYGRSKLDAENYILSKNISNKKVYILMPCMIHGPKNKGSLNALYSFVSKGIPYPFGRYNNLRSFLSIDNLCFVICSLLNKQNDIPSGIYNLADDQPISSTKFVSIIGSSPSVPVRIWNLPKVIIKTFGLIGDFLPLPINSERIGKLTENYVVSNDKIKASIGINELPLTGEQGLKKIIVSFNN